MSNSYPRSCKYCGRWISMRRMPAGQWVAFEDEAAHKCAAPPKAKPARKSRPPLAAPVDDDFGEFVLPHDKPTTRVSPAIARIDITKAPAPQPPVQGTGPELDPRFRLPAGRPIAVAGQESTRPTLPRAEPVHPAPYAPPQDFGKWLLRFLALILVLGLLKTMMRAHPTLSKTDFAPPIRSDAIDPDQSVSAPATPNTPGSAKKAADAAVIACIEQYASQDLKSGGDHILGAYKSRACEDHVRRIYPGTRGDPAPGEPYPYPPVDPRR